MHALLHHQHHNREQVVKILTKDLSDILLVGDIREDFVVLQWLGVIFVVGGQLPRSRKVVLPQSPRAVFRGAIVAIQASCWVNLHEWTRIDTQF